MSREALGSAPFVLAKKKSTSFESLPYPFSVLLKKTMNLFWLLYLFHSVHFEMLKNSWIGREQ